ncbi:MAG: ATP-binding protein [Thermomicrobiales bacterium]
MPGSTLAEPLTSLVGREGELTELAALLPRQDVRLVTLTGPGGVGKTRLAIGAALHAAPTFPDGVVFVDLATISDPDLVAPTIAQALGLSDVVEGSVAAALTGWLRGRRFMLVLDNFEQVVVAAPLVADLLTVCRDLTVLATSREPLKIGCEREFPVAPLTLPGSTDTRSVEMLGRSNAVQLFVERARAALPDFAPSDEDGPNLAEICRRVDGLPLAIELAAARIKVLPLAAIRARLDRRLPVLSGTRRDAPQRQQTMRNAIAWSHDLVTPEEQALFRRLAVFVGGFSLEAAETMAVVPRDPGIEVFEGVASLVDKSLLRCVERPAAADSSEPRYRMLETVREFGLERLVESGEAEAVRTAHAGWYIELAASAGQSFDSGRDVARWLDRLDAELANLRIALEWSLQSGDARGMLQLLGSTDDYWCARPYRAEARRGLETALAAASDAPAAVRSKAIHVLVMVTGILGDLSTAVAHAEQGLDVARGLGDPLSLGRAHYDLGLAHEYAGNTRAAAAAYGEAVPLLRQAGLVAWAALALGNHAYLSLLKGDVVGAVPLLDEALTILHETGYASGVALVLGQRAYAALAAGDLGLAARLFTESISAARSIAFARAELGAIAGLAGVAAARGELERAARLLGAVEAAHEARASSRRIAHAPHAELIAADVRGRLGKSAYGTARSAGRSMSFDAALADALRLAASAVAPLTRRQTEQGFGLTARERDVLRLLVQGQSDKGIADALFIGTRTIETHVSNLLAKLGAHNRAEAAALAVREGLV